MPQGLSQALSPAVFGAKVHIHFLYHTALCRAQRFELFSTPSNPQSFPQPRHVVSYFRDLIRARGEEELRLTHARGLGGSVRSVNERYERKGTGPRGLGLSELRGTERIDCIG